MAKLRRVKARRAKPFSKLIQVIGWIAGILVALAVGFGMAQQTLKIPWLDSIGAGVLTIAAGWVVIILTIVGVIVAIIDLLS